MNVEIVNMMISLTVVINTRVVAGVIQLNVWYVQPTNWCVQTEACHKLSTDKSELIDSPCSVDGIKKPPDVVIHSRVTWHSIWLSNDCCMLHIAWRIDYDINNNTAIVEYGMPRNRAQVELSLPSAGNFTLMNPFSITSENIITA